MRMVILTITEAQQVLFDMECAEEECGADLHMSVEIIEEALRQPQEYDIDSKNNTVSTKGHRDI